MRTLPKVSICITNWNGEKYCINCLSSISKLNYPKKHLEVIVVDNGSKDGSVVAINKKFPWVKILAQEINLGFTRGMNIALKSATGKYSLILNNDEILDKNCIKELVKVAESDKKIAMAGAKIYYLDYPKKIQCMWGKIDYATMHVDRVGVGEIDKGQYERITEADYVSFSAIVKNDVLKKLGYLDEKYFHSFEDTDLMIRLKKAGYKLIFVPKAKIWHKGGVSYGQNTPRIIYYVSRNNLLIRNKFNQFTFKEHYKNFRFLISSFLTSLISTGKNKKLYFAVFRGILDFYLARFGPGSYYVNEKR